MRRFLAFLLYLAMVVGGLYLLWGMFAYGGRMILALVGGALAAFGAYLIWADFLAPHDRREQP